MSIPDGWLTKNEADELTRLAEGKVVLELGSYLGRSTLALARSAARVVTIDLHRAFTIKTGEAYEDTLADYFENVGGHENVVSIVGPFEAARLFRRDAFGLVFVDGVHDAVNVRADLTLAFEFEATVAVHDWGRFDLPKVAVDLGLHPHAVVDHLAVWK